MSPGVLHKEFRYALQFRTERHTIGIGHVCEQMFGLISKPGQMTMIEVLIDVLSLVGIQIDG